MQDRDGRRGSVFSVRMTDSERIRLERLRRRVGGPRAMGPWLLWSAQQYAGAGSTRAARVLPARAPRDGTTRAHRGLILDLCGGSGSWSKPYRDAGYDVQLVTLPDHDVRLFELPKGPVHGVLAAPPCTEFSLAKNGRPRKLTQGLEVVDACLRIIMQCRPKWWALENPVGLLSKWLGTPRDVWDPCDFGDPWTKRTAIWGDYEIPTRGPWVNPLGGGPFCEICDPARKRLAWCSNAAHRAITPPGFARAFFEANP